MYYFVFVKLQNLGINFLIEHIFQDAIEEEDDPEEESGPKLTEAQLSVTPIFFQKFNQPPTKYLFLLTRSYKCFLLLISGENNASMVHGAVHIITCMITISLFEFSISKARNNFHL